MTNKIVGIDSAKKPEECLFCDDHHSSLRCPRVKFLELFDDGSIAAVEFFDPPPRTRPAA